MKRMRSGIMTLVVISLLGACSPEPVSMDKDGKVRGSGELLYKYPDGKVKLRENYTDGVLVNSTWYKLDGSEIAHTKWQHGSGVGYYLRDDGMIKSTMTYENSVANGIATYFDPLGKIQKTVMFKDGQAVWEKVAE